MYIVYIVLSSDIVLYIVLSLIYSDIVLAITNILYISDSTVIAQSVYIDSVKCAPIRLGVLHQCYKIEFALWGGYGQ